MKKKIISAYKRELDLAKEYYHKRQWTQAFQRLERAHILGQRYVLPHTVSHFWMLKIGLKTGDRQEIVGQLFRIATGVLGSALGILPVGNTGGSNVNPFKVMPIPADLKEILAKHENELKP